MKRLLQTIAVTALFFASFQAANAATLTFDDIASNSDGWGYVANGYGGLNWDNMGWVNKNTYGLYSTVSGNNSVYNDNGLATSIIAPTGTQFDFNSAYIRSIYNDNNVLSINAYRNGQIVGSQSIALTTAYTDYNLNFDNIDKISFSTTSRDMNMDNIDIKSPTTPVPEPSSIILGIMGLGSVLGFRRKK